MNGPLYKINFLCPFIIYFPGGGSEKYKYILNRFFRAPTPKYGKKKFLAPPPKKKKIWGDGILNGVLRVPDPESAIKIFWDPPRKKNFGGGHLKWGFEGP